jgi:hypothetical protein
MCGGVLPGRQHALDSGGQNAPSVKVQIGAQIVARGDLPGPGFCGSGNFRMNCPNAKQPNRAQEPCCKKITNERMRTNNMAGAMAAPAEEAVKLSLFNEGAGFVHGNAGCDRAEGQVDCFEDRGAHQELLQIVREVADHFLGEVFIEMPLSATQRRDERADLRRLAIVDGGTD